ncbi:MAG TPA: hypothetical protein VHB27_20650 [Rhodopila sp.]|uniref:hypothetical protein n=1 Tax=Rhodopila sp. TaxID=2480087 RepID=UPI002D162436|nr:hypothetical protein [Rhodopila sp.]HVY17641.1 hypothetical protein [Rhodopila sp.]
MARRRMSFLVLSIAGLALGACTDELARRQAELNRWVGRPETELVQAMGAPNRSYETGGLKILTYEDHRVDIIPGTSYYPGFGPFWPDAGLPPQAINLTCDTSFAVSGGIVRSFSLRGNACG